MIPGTLVLFVWGGGVSLWEALFVVSRSVPSSGVSVG